MPATNKSFPFNENIAFNPVCVVDVPPTTILVFVAKPKYAVDEPVESPAKSKYTNDPVLVASLPRTKSCELVVMRTKPDTEFQVQMESDDPLGGQLIPFCKHTFTPFTKIEEVRMEVPLAVVKPSQLVVAFEVNKSDNVVRPTTVKVEVTVEEPATNPPNNCRVVVANDPREVTSASVSVSSAAGQFVPVARHTAWPFTKIAFELSVPPEALVKPSQFDVALVNNPFTENVLVELAFEEETFVSVV